VDPSRPKCATRSTSLCQCLLLIVTRSTAVAARIVASMKDRVYVAIRELIWNGCATSKLSRVEPKEIEY
jgi:hypothetical protein